jgi:biopolymer transport protein ExbD
MAKSPNRVLDVWIVETQAIYTDVPFTVVADWVQQGRLLADDRVRLAGNKTWHLVSKVPALNPYLPRAEPLETSSASEALQPVDLGWNWRQPEETEDEDVDMIPLIDISLVLLIFFMMTATISSGILAPIQTPETQYPHGMLAADQFWIGVDTKGPGPAKKNDSRIWYSLGRDKEELAAPTDQFADFLGTLTRQFAQEKGEVKVRIRADRGLPIETVTGLIRDLREMQARINNDPGLGPLNLVILGEVSEGR